MRVTPQIICDILKKCMSLQDDQIWIYNQRRSIPEDKRLYVVVGLISSKTYGNTNIKNEENGDFRDELSQYVQETISIDVFSYTTEAIERYSEVIGSIKSTYSQRAQEENALKISEIPLSINDVSAVEGAAIINRISVTLLVMRKYSMLIRSDYCDQIQPGYIHFVNK